MGESFYSLSDRDIILLIFKFMNGLVFVEYGSDEIRVGWNHDKLNGNNQKHGVIDEGWPRIIDGFEEGSNQRETENCSE